MSITELYQQAQALSPDERKILIQMLERLDDDTWTDEELAELLTVEPMTGAEIVAAGLTGGWANQDIADGAEWVNQQREKRKERRQL